MRGELCDSDEVGICCAHMHFGCANKTNTGSATHYKGFFDTLARGIVQYKQRVLCMDANMALWAVVPELRARGFLVTMVSFFPFINMYGPSFIIFTHFRLLFNINKSLS